MNLYQKLFGLILMAPAGDEEFTSSGGDRGDTHVPDDNAVDESQAAADAAAAETRGASILVTPSDSVVSAAAMAPGGGKHADSDLTAVLALSSTCAESIDAPELPDTPSPPTPLLPI